MHLIVVVRLFNQFFFFLTEPNFVVFCHSGIKSGVDKSFMVYISRPPISTSDQRLYFMMCDFGGNMNIGPDIMLALVLTVS